MRKVIRMGEEISLKEHLKRMVNKATTMGWNTKQVHDAIDRIVDEHKEELEINIRNLIRRW